MFVLKKLMLMLLHMCAMVGIWPCFSLQGNAPQKTSDLIFQAPKIGPVKLCPDDLLAVYDPPTQGVILVTRAQYDKVRNECYLKLLYVCPSVTAPAQSPL